MRSLPVYIIAARRTAIGRIGGLHRQRRVEDLAAPVVEAVLKDAGVGADEVDEIIVGNCTAGDNPARLIALASGLPIAAMATTVDQQCASGLEAILSAARRIAAGEADIVVAGGVEALSTAPWRIAKPRSLFQTPHFIRPDPMGAPPMAEHVPHASCEGLAERLGITRAAQDAWTLASHAKATEAREGRRFVGEIVPLRSTTEEARDQSAVDPDADDLADLEPLAGEGGTLTAGNISTLHDGAAFVVAVSEAEWERRGRPPALRPVVNAALGVEPGREAEAPIVAMQKLYGRLNGLDRSAISIFELSEASAVQAIALCRQLGIDEAKLNPDGGAVVRGHPLGASGAVLVTRLFSRLVRCEPRAKGARYGVAALGASGGLALAALFERR
ncbi:MAG TPA: thiolase family protein [Hyphomicrobiaceae bacterium]|nr:thiolase family protein [Hyphomicrobiaceae bacterium]